MDIKEIKNLTPYQDINNLLADWTKEVKNILGENLVGLYLSGSLTYGDFVLDRSDIDLQAIVRHRLNQDKLNLVEYLHKDISKRYPEWKSRLECSYVPLELMKVILPPKTTRPWYGYNTLYREAPPGNEWVINHYFLSKYGISLEGPDFKTLAPSIKRDDVKKASARDLFKEWEPKINDPVWLSNPHYQYILF